MYERILVPLDGSDAAEVVLPYVAEIGAKSGATITLVTVSESQRSDLDHLYRSYLEQVAERVKVSLRSRSGEEANRLFTRVLLGVPADEILRYADESDADLVVIASRGSERRSTWLLGSVAAKVLRISDKPALLIRAPVDASGAVPAQIIKKILVPLDGSAVGEAAVPHAAALAKTLGAGIVLYNALEPVPTWAYSAGTGVHIPQVYFEGARDSSLAYLEGLRDRLTAEGLTASVEVQDGRAADLIIEYAESRNIDLIAMSTHGRSGVGRWVFGSVTDKVLHSGDTPVLVIQSAGK